MGHPSGSWTEVDRTLARLDTVPDAAKSLAVLRRALRQWSQAVDVRTSMHDLVFSLHGDDFPFERAVALRWGPPATVILTRRGIKQDVVEIALETAHAVLSRALAWLCDGIIWCARCGGKVVASADDYETFEHMHWVCFHYEFEHGATDVDRRCGDFGCPSPRA